MNTYKKINKPTIQILIQMKKILLIFSIIALLSCGKDEEQKLSNILIEFDLKKTNNDGKLYYLYFDVSEYCYVENIKSVAVNGVDAIYFKEEQKFLKVAVTNDVYKYGLSKYKLHIYYIYEKI